MHYYRWDGVWNGAGHQSRAPFEEMMHWGKMQCTLGCRALAVNDPRISNNILPSVDKMQCAAHTNMAEMRNELNKTEVTLLVLYKGSQELEISHGRPCRSNRFETAL